MIMKHLARIQSEFMKEARRWEDLTYEEQRDYLQRHPKSQRRMTTSPGQSIQKVPMSKRRTKVDFPEEAAKNAFKAMHLGSHSSRDDAEVIKDKKGNVVGIETAFRDLGIWRSRPGEEDDDYPNWDEESRKKYTERFKSWLSQQHWYDPNTWRPYISGSEKAWVHFGIQKRDLKKEKALTRYFKALVKDALVRLNEQAADFKVNLPGPSTEKLNQLREKAKKRSPVVPTSYFAEQMLKQKRDGTWKVDKKKFQKALNEIT